MSACMLVSLFPKFEMTEPRIEALVSRFTEKALAVGREDMDILEDVFPSEVSDFPHDPGLALDESELCDAITRASRGLWTSLVELLADSDGDVTWIKPSPTDPVKYWAQGGSSWGDALSGLATLFDAAGFFHDVYVMCHTYATEDAKTVASY